MASPVAKTKSSKSQLKKPQSTVTAAEMKKIREESILEHKREWAKLMKLSEALDEFGIDSEADEAFLRAIIASAEMLNQLRMVNF